MLSLPIDTKPTQQCTYRTFKSLNSRDFWQKLRGLATRLSKHLLSDNISQKFVVAVNGLVQAENTYEASITNVQSYVFSRADADVKPRI